ncbi:hypothetical protein QN394_26240, partial [Pseudomonas sp. 5S2]
ALQCARRNTCALLRRLSALIDPSITSYAQGDDTQKKLIPANHSSIVLTDQLVRPGPANRQIFTCDLKKTERRLAPHWTYR